MFVNRLSGEKELPHDKHPESPPTFDPELTDLDELLIVYVPTGTPTTLAW
jgi:hypothetical protein